MKKIESNRKRKRVETDQCDDDLKENFQPLNEIQLPGILKNIRTSDGMGSFDDIQTRAILSKEEKTYNPGQTEDDWEWTESFELTKKRKPGGPSSTAIPDHIETDSAAQTSEMSDSNSRKKSCAAEVYKMVYDEIDSAPEEKTKVKIERRPDGSRISRRPIPKKTGRPVPKYLSKTPLAIMDELKK